MERTFQGVIDRTRTMLDIKMLKTIFGYKHRPFKCKGKGKSPRFEAVVERPVYDLTVFKIHFGKLTVKMYSKGERVLRIEAIAHNTKELRCGKVIERFPVIIETLKEILERFLGVLRGVDMSFIDSNTLENWPIPTTVGASRVGGIDVNKPRIKAVMKSLIALSANPRGFTPAELAEKVRERLKVSETQYRSRQASYDLKKFRGKKLVTRIAKSRCYKATWDGLRTMAAFTVLHEKVMMPLLASAGKRYRGPKGPNRTTIDIHYDNIQIEMQNIFNHIGIAA